MKVRLRLLATADAIRQSYWFLPGCFALAGLLAAVGLVAADGVLGQAWLGDVAWFTASRPQGARAVLSTIASSTITVAGVVFSVTLAAVTYASGQYGPRLLTNFQRDQGNQATLGVFIATFVYCLVVLRTIRSAEEASADTAGAVREAFIPHAATHGAMLLAFASIAMLVYFVHHVTDSIHINNVIARIGSDLLDHARSLPQATDDNPDPPDAADSRPVTSDKAGYVEAVDTDALLEFAEQHDLVLVLACLPGTFVWAGQPLLTACPPPPAEVEARIRRSFALGRKRTALQDLHFGIDELVEIAARALSPGVNDPFTAIACMDWLGAVLAELPGRQQIATVMRDSGDRPRLFAAPSGFASFVEAAFGQLRPYVAHDPNASAHALKLLDRLIAETELAEARALLATQRLQLVDTMHRTSTR